MAHTVTDATILLGILAGVGDTDPATWQSAVRDLPDYHQSLGVQGLKGERGSLSAGSTMRV